MPSKKRKTSPRARTRKRTRKSPLPVHDITDPLWSIIFRLAVQFRDQACWEWLLDTDIFYYEDKETEFSGLVSIMGYLGEFTSLAYYFGADGIRSYLRLATSEEFESPQNVDLVLEEQALMLIFGDLQDIHPDERQLFKSLDLRFRSSGAYLHFRKKLPGTPMIHMNRQELEVMKRVLEAVLSFTEFLETNPEALPSIREKLGFVPDISEPVRVSIQSPEIPWIELADLVPLESTKTVNSAILPSKNVDLQKGWIIEQFFSRTMVENEKNSTAYFPRITMVLDPRTQLIFWTEVAPPDNPVGQIENVINKVYKNRHYLPGVIYSSEERVLEALEIWAQHNGIRLVMIDKSMTAEIRERMSHPGF